uniref:hypothetical protein n=1 Tax=Rhodaphanes brevistipitata TaxID=446136 RepID=UPI001FCDB5E3|nr:hypothetical protein MW432_pgp190 [Rhodaphanes brevistipitata]UNJ18391.1 hypothetical protein [Rhodaphanes brevistipitata]
MVNIFPIIYLSIIIVLLSILIYILTKPILQTYQEIRRLKKYKACNDFNIDSEEKAQQIYQMGVFYWTHYYYAEALQCFSSILLNRIFYTKKELSYIYFQIGNLYVSLNYFDLGIQNYNISSELLPGNEQILLKLAKTLKENSNYNASKQVYQKLLHISPNNLRIKKEIDTLDLFLV